MLGGVVKLLYARKVQVEKRINAERLRLGRIHEQLEHLEESTDTEGGYSSATSDAGRVSEVTDVDSGDESSSVNSEKLDIIRSKLAEFYSKHNPAKVKDVDKILQHFDNRLGALNEALMVTYGVGLQIDSEPKAKTVRFNADEDKDKDEEDEENNGKGSDELERKKTELRKLFDASELHALKYDLHRMKNLYKVALREFYMPRSQNYKFSFVSTADTTSSSDKAQTKTKRSGKEVNKTKSVSIIGAQDVFLDNLSGVIKVELSCRDKPNGRKGLPKFRVWTPKPVSVKARVTGFKFVQNCHSQSPTVHDFKVISLESEIMINICFEYNPNKAMWIKPAGHEQTLRFSKLKTHMLSLADQLLRTVVNSMLPPVLFRLIKRSLPPELGKMLYSKPPKEKKAQSDNEKDDEIDLKISIEVEFRVTGWPALKDWDVNLIGTETGSNVSRRNRILKELDTTANDLGFIHRAIHSLPQKKGGSHGDAKNKSTSLSLKDLLHLHEALNDKRAEEDCFKQNHNTVRIFSKAKRLIQELKQRIESDKIAHSTRENVDVDLDKLMLKVGNILRKPISVEMDVREVNIVVDADKVILMLKSFLWRSAKASHRAMKEGHHLHNLKRTKSIRDELKQIHKLSAILKFSLESFKSFVDNAQFLVTGAFTGGKCPAYELCMKDLSVSGVTDAGMVNFRIGGQLPTLNKWILRLLKRIGSNGEAEKEKERNIDTFSRVKEQVMKNLDLFQFFIQVSSVTQGKTGFSMFTHEDEDDESSNDEEDSFGEQLPLIISIQGKRGDPRPPFSLHFRGNAVDSLNEIFKVQKQQLKQEEGSKSQSVGTSSDANGVNGVKENNPNALKIYEKCMQLVHNQGITFPATASQILQTLTVAQQQSHVFYLTRVVLSAVSSATNARALPDEFRTYVDRRMSLAEFEMLVLLSGELFYLSNLDSDDDPLLDSENENHENSHSFRKRGSTLSELSSVIDSSSSES